MNDGACRVRVCRDCCCGTARKHPGVDHDRLLQRLTEGVAGGAQVSISSCLLACDQSNVVVVSPSKAGRRAQARAVWFKKVLDERAVDAISEWVVRGGPGLAPMPSMLAAYETTSPSLAEGLATPVREYVEAILRLVDQAPVEVPSIRDGPA
jgi:(2Fe-2S) ferredoxin